MQPTSVINLATSARLLGPRLHHGGSSARVLGDDTQYPPVEHDFERRILQDAPTLLPLLSSPAGKATIAQRLQVLDQAYKRLLHAEPLTDLLQNPVLQSLAPINIQGISDALGSETITKEILRLYYTYATLSFIANTNTGMASDATSLAATAKTLGRLTYELEYVADDLLHVSEQTIAENEALKDSLAGLAPKLPITDLTGRIQGDTPNPELFEEDIATLLGAVLRAVHYLPEFQALRTQPVSLVWSNAALYELFRTSTARVETAPQLAQIIRAHIDVSDPFVPTMEPIQQLLTIGRRIVAAWYQGHQPAKPIWETSPDLAKQLQPGFETPWVEPSPQPKTAPIDAAPTPTGTITTQQISVNNKPVSQAPVVLPSEPVITPPVQPAPAPIPGATVDLRHPDDAPPVAPTPPQEPPSTDQQSKIKPINLQ